MKNWKMQRQVSSMWFFKKWLFSVTALHSCYIKIAFILSQSDKRKFSCISSTNQQISGKLVVFEKFPSVYEHQIALKGILLPIKIDDMYDRKQIKT